MITLLLVHDACLMRSALAARLACEDDLDVFHSPWRTAPHRADSLRPDVCAVDLDSSGSYESAPLEALGNQRSGPDTTQLLVLASAHRPGPLRRAVEARAVGYVDKEGTPEHLVHAIRQVATGERFVDDSLGFGFLKAAHIPLTKRELTVLSLTAEGASTADIAHSLHLAYGTIRNYIAAITRKTGARNRIDAIRISQGEGWL